MAIPDRSSDIWRALVLTPDDGYPTPTSHAQEQTEQELVDAGQGLSDRTTLKRDTHVQFLARNLLQGFPSRYQAYDCSQAWLIYWTLQAFALLQVGMDPNNRQKIVDKVLQWQHPNGGFGGGPGQYAHLLGTYAAVCSLAIAGKPGPGGGWDQIDRKKMYAWFMSLKQPDGSFLVSVDGEVDVRGVYCLLCVASLLNMLTPELIEGTASFIASCQTYEGGFASASQPFYGVDGKLLSSPRPPLGEAHGGYTFCAAAAWVMLRPFTRLIPSKERPSINARSLKRWLTQMQGQSSEIGGFRGRTNKLVDGCYAWWVGGCFGLLESLDVSDVSQKAATQGSPLYDRTALQEYVIIAGQHPNGGLRDKPSKPADSYHTLYCLSGLSSAQHSIHEGSKRRGQLNEAWKANEDGACPEPLLKEIFLDALSWTEDESGLTLLGGAPNTLNATHPVLDLTMTHAESIMAHFYEQTIPQRPRP